MSESDSPATLTGSIGRALLTLQAIAEQGEFTPRMIAAEVGLPTSTAYRLIQSLSAMNFVEKSSHGSYRVGRQLLRMASLIVDQFDYDTVAQPLLAELAEAFEETAAFALYLPKEYCFMIVSAVTAKHPLQYVVEKYARRPMIGGALGRSMLPFLPEKDVKEAIARQERQHEPNAKRIEREDLYEEFEAVHRNGCFIATSPNTVGSNGTAAPVFNSRGQLLGSLGVTVPSIRYNAAIQPEVSAAVIASARRLSETLGFGREGSREKPSA